MVTESPTNERASTAARPRTRPVLLLLVYGVFLVLIGVTAMAQAVLVSAHFTTSLLSSTVAGDAATVRNFLNANLIPEDLDGTLSPERVATLRERLATLAAGGEILHSEIRTVDGRVVAADTEVGVGTQAVPSDAFAAAVAGAAQADVVDAAGAEAVGVHLATPSVIRAYLPIVADGQVRGVFGVWRDGVPILARLDAMRRDVVVVTLVAALIAAMVLYTVFRSADARIRRQTLELLEAARHDGQTGLLNHGSMVALLEGRLELARSVDQALTIAIVDIDNFRLLNEVHGHSAGDRALLTVARTLRREIPGQILLGRYGPDEFLLVADGRSTEALGAALIRLTAALVDVSLQFGAGERLPVTVSAGVASYPDHADSVTALLSSAAVTLVAAKASGGDTIRYAGQRDDAVAGHDEFDVLQGLVIAVDTKDRYTKRHSEDVARYAMFLADRLGLDHELRRTLRLAGLLHDVGKIGIPDNILRKPGELTHSEQLVVQQHVALGDSIVRSVPSVDAVRSAIRFHHERWDGRGYLDRLEGDQIPLIARVIAVGDVFSAMTTSRPYRKALSVEEALRRLGDAAGTQLDERLVRAFIEGIETADNPPLPGQDSAASRLWQPARAVA